MGNAIKLNKNDDNDVNIKEVLDTNKSICEKIMRFEARKSEV